MTIKTYHYYVVGALSFVAWVVLVVLALEVAVHLSA
jgi:hypothetical protein